MGKGRTTPPPPVLCFCTKKLITGTKTLEAITNIPIINKNLDFSILFISTFICLKKLMAISSLTINIFIIGFDVLTL